MAEQRDRSWDVYRGRELWESNGPEAGTVRVKDINPGSNTSNPGYNAFPSGTFTFAAGQTSLVITIPVRGDTTFEATENFRVALSIPRGGVSVTTAVASGVIRNDDTSLAIAATSANKSEGNSE